MPAIADYRLTTTRYVRPGTYIGYVRIPRAIVLGGNPRLPCFVGVGNRLARSKDIGHKRAEVLAEDLTFTTAPPYRAVLDHEALNDQSQALLLKASGDPVPTDKWAFVETITGSGDYDQVEIVSTDYDSTTTYEIDYQSVDRDVLDILRFDDLRDMLLVGDTEGQEQYVEGTDYRVPVSLVGDATDTDAVDAASTNSATAGSVSAIVAAPAVGTGTVAFNAGSSYLFPYNRQYVLTCLAFGGASPNRTATFSLQITALSGGNSQIPDVPLAATMDAPRIQIDETVEGTLTARALDNLTTGYFNTSFPLPTPYTALDDGIRLDFDWGGGGAANFAVNDAFTWTAFGPGLIEFSSAHDNTNQFSSVAAPTENLTNTTAGGSVASTSSGAISVNIDTDYTGTLDRAYYFVVDDTPAPAGFALARTATIQWTGYGERNYTSGTISLEEAVATSYTDVLLEQGVRVNFAFGTEHQATDGVNTLTTTDASTLTTAIALANAAKVAYNAHNTDVGPVWHYANNAHAVTAADSVDLATLIVLCLDLQVQYNAHIGDIGAGQMHHGTADTFTLGITTPADLTTCITFLNDLKAKYNRHRVAQHFIAFDSWTMLASAPRVTSLAKDDRNYTMTCTAVAPGASTSFSYYTDTFEGGWGSFVVSDYNSPFMAFPDDLTLAVRNLSTTEQFAANDSFTWSSACDDTIDWSLQRKSAEVTAVADIRQDVTGSITGTPLTYFIVLSETPSAIIKVKDSVSGAQLSYTFITGTPYVTLTALPSNPVETTYTWIGEEPGPSQTYYVTANRLRASTEYNNPTLYTDRETMQDALAPLTTDNHLYIAGDIGFDADFFGMYACQVESAAGTNFYSIADWRTAIDATELKTGITDVVLLSRYDAIGYAKTSIQNMNDPFVAKERLLWVGAPIGTPVGDVDTPNSFVYLAKRTLQFTGDNPGRGCVILVGHPDCKRTITLEDGTATQLTLDGTFLAAYAAAQTASFADPASTILGLDITAFDEVNDWDEADALLIGAASILYAVDVGAPVYRWDESVTVDTSAPDLNEISAMTQKHYVTRLVRDRMSSALIGIVPPSTTAGIIRIQSYLVEVLQGIVSSGVIAPYGQELNPPVIRPINPSADVGVFVDDNDRRYYHFRYFYNLRYPIKRLLGVYSVDQKFWA